MGGAGGATSGIMPVTVKGRAEGPGGRPEAPSLRPPASGDFPRPGPAASQPPLHPVPSASSLAGLASCPPSRRPGAATQARPMFAARTRRAWPRGGWHVSGRALRPTAAATLELCLRPAPPARARSARVSSPVAQQGARAPPATCAQLSEGRRAPSRVACCGSGRGRGPRARGAPAAPGEPGPWGRGSGLLSHSGASPALEDRTVGGRPAFVAVVSTGTPAPSACLAPTLDSEAGAFCTSPGDGQVCGGRWQAQVYSAAQQLVSPSGALPYSPRAAGTLRTSVGTRAGSCALRPSAADGQACPLAHRGPRPA